MYIFCLILVVLVILLGCLCLYNSIRIANLSILLGEVDNEVSEINGELTKHEAHTKGALTGSYFMMKELENKFESHYHSYSFENGVLYIQEPIINEATYEEDSYDGGTGEEVDTDNINPNQE